MISVTCFVAFTIYANMQYMLLIAPHLGDVHVTHASLGVCIFKQTCLPPQTIFDMALFSHVPIMLSTVVWCDYSDALYTGS